MRIIADSVLEISIIIKNCGLYNVTFRRSRLFPPQDVHRAKWFRSSSTFLGRLQWPETIRGSYVQILDFTFQLAFVLNCIRVESVVAIRATRTAAAIIGGIRTIVFQEFACWKQIHFKPKREMQNNSTN